MRDYHTVQVPASQSKVTYRTRRDELNAPRKVINTILSSRDYRCDGLWTVAVWLTPQAELTLEEMEQALKTPHFPLYLGRKACPPAAPLARTGRDVINYGMPWMPISLRYGAKIMKRNVGH